MSLELGRANIFVIVTASKLSLRTGYNFLGHPVVKENLLKHEIHVSTNLANFVTCYVIDSI